MRSAVFCLHFRIEISCIHAGFDGYRKTFRHPPSTPAGRLSTEFCRLFTVFLGFSPFRVSSVLENQLQQRRFPFWGKRPVEQFDHRQGELEAGDDLFSQNGTESDVSWQRGHDAPLPVKDQVERGVVRGKALGSARHLLAVEGLHTPLQVLGGEKPA